MIKGMMYWFSKILLIWNVGRGKLEYTNFTKKKKKILSEYKIKKSSDVAELESSIDKYIFGFIYVPLTSVHFLWNKQVTVS